jgi:hypothetical protein
MCEVRGVANTPVLQRRCLAGPGKHWLSGCGSVFTLMLPTQVVPSASYCCEHRSQQLATHFNRF